jgi:pseudouridine synthase
MVQEASAMAATSDNTGKNPQDAAGRVTVNGTVVTEPGRRVDPAIDKVVVDGQAVQLDPSRRYLMLNKPVGVVSSLRDERGRPDLTEFTRHYAERLFNVGRLDAETSGLLILTNDGELAHVLAHPSFGVLKTYIAKVQGSITPATVKKLIAGIDLEDGEIHADSARIVDRGTGQAGGTSIVEITLHSGRNRIVRRMLDAVGHPVVDLVRRQFGPLNLGTLRVGEVRDLTRDELGEILTIARDAEVGGAREAELGGDRVAEALAIVAAVQQAQDDTGVELVADVEDDVASSEKEYYDEDDEEYEPELDARDESRRGRVGAAEGGLDRRVPKKQYDSDGNRRVAVNGDVTGGRAAKGGAPSRRSEVRKQQEQRRRGSGR